MSIRKYVSTHGNVLQSIIDYFLMKGEKKNVDDLKVISGLKWRRNSPVVT